MTRETARKRQLHKGARTRTMIKDAALGLYARSGWKGITIEEICQATGLTVGAFYFHFDSKDALLDEIATESSADYHKEIVKSIDWNGDFYAISYHVIESYYQSLVRNPMQFRLIYTIIMRRSAAYLAWKTNREVLRAHLEAAIDRARAQGGDQPQEPTSVFVSHWLLASLEDFVWSVFMAKDNADLAALASGPDVFVRQQATLWYRSVLGENPSHPLSRMGSQRPRGG